MAKKNIILKNASWTFSGNVAKSFDSHITKSVPFYNKIHELGLDISDFFLQENSKVLDIGCSTGSFARKLQQKNRNKKLKIIAIDTEKIMIMVLDYF